MLRPLKDWVIVKPIKNDKVRGKSGFEAESDKKDVAIFGKVVGVTNDSPVGVGDFIFYKNYAGHECFFNSQSFIGLETQDIICIAKEENV